MRLVDLNPGWVGAGGAGIWRKNPTTGELEPVPGRTGVAIVFDCPCGCPNRCYVPFTNALDGGGPVGDDARRGELWERTGDTFETLTLTPSVHRATILNGCGWHGHITNGEVKSC